MGDDLQDKLRKVRELFDRSKETFYEGHAEGMDALAASAGEEQSNRIDEAIKAEERAVGQMSDAIELQREAIEEQRRRIDNGEEEASAPSE